jgi:RNA polymerase sigma-70 factor (ECF subfamily)
MLGTQRLVNTAPSQTSKGDESCADPLPGLEELYERHFDFIWRSLRRLGVADGALDDAVQEVFITAYQRLDAFEGRSSVRSWLFGITIHVAQRAHRNAKRQPVGEANEARLEACASGPHDLAEHNESVRLLHQLISAMDLERRAVFVLTELEEMTAPEIADALGIPVNTVYSRLRIARRDFNAALARHRARDRWRQP